MQAKDLLHRTPFQRRSYVRKTFMSPTFGEGSAVHGACGGPALAGAVEAAVADAAARRAHPFVQLLNLQDVLPVPHEQAVPAENALHSSHPHLSEVWGINEESF